MAATITAIAKEAKVSTGLVSRFFRDDPTLKVSEATSKRIRIVERRLGGVRASRTSRLLSMKLAHNVVLPVRRQLMKKGVIGSEWAGSLFQELQSTLQAKGFHLSINVFDGDETLATFTRLIDSPNYCDGIFLLGGTGVINEPLAKLLLERRFPHVGNSSEDDSFGINTVSAHMIGGLRQAITHLCELGHERIGFFGPVESRYPMYGAVMIEKSLAIDEECNCIIPVYGLDDSYSKWLRSAREEFEAWLERRPPASALICQNDDLALIAVDIMRRKGLRPGRDISIVGYDNIEQRRSESSAHPFVTTIDNPQKIIGRCCGELLFKQIMRKQHHIVHEYIPTKLIVRETTGPCGQKGEKWKE